MGLLCFDKVKGDKMFLDDPISKIKNIGEKRALLFSKLNIFTVRGLIEYYPRDYEDRGNIKKIDELIAGESNAFIGKVVSPAENLLINGKKITKLIFKDEAGKLEIIWFNMFFLKNVFVKGQEYIFYGKVTDKFGRLRVESPEYELVSGGGLVNAGRIVPVYSLTHGLSQKFLRTTINYVLENIEDDIADVMPNYIRERYSLMDKKPAITNIHFPESESAFFKARGRLVFEELFFMQASLIKLKGYIKNRVDGLVFKEVDISTLDLPFALTNAQERALAEIISDEKSGYAMNRLVQGDVGSGKTVIALISAYVAIKNGYQVCLMAPTEVLANQHFIYFKGYFDKLGIKTELLVGSLTKRQKNSIYFNIESGFTKMIIGTHAIIQSGVRMKNLGYVITDEQHRFGVGQRRDLTLKGNNPHVLVMTATPIPRTLALILYGDLDISIIDEMPPGRQNIDTFFVTGKYLPRVHNFIREEAEKGRQIYIICPSIDGENEQLKSVLSYTEVLAKELSPLKVNCLHGKMKQDEKNLIMDGFSKNLFSVLVSTTVIEVGINVKNATLIIIENAERFGLSQLHQLRGRVGRDSHKSYCILISDTKNKYSKQRLQMMVQTNDGFAISEMDLKLRGPGEFFGLKQHGIQELKIANIYKDMEILKLVSEAVNIDYSLLSNEEIVRLDNELCKILDYESNSVFL
ncbi:MAG: ATP-dependent DNA helicase RecG [Clostridiales bacterium]|jgi:ATP-dependent DNA helicase RecG|nr:ATP-dependent DNA helicase RecG [Clostridiales bacterium]